MTATGDPQWLKTGWGFKVSSVDELNRAISRIGTLQSGRTYVWRGVADHRWRVRSSLLRRLLAHKSLTELDEDQVRQTEVALIRRARDWGLGLDGAGSIPELQLLATMQHHNLPTRLLDVTSNPHTGLWFACERAPGRRDAAGALFAFDVTGLQRIPTIDAHAHGTWAGASDPLQSLLNDSAARNAPFLVEPSLPDRRMLAQEGLFITGAVPVSPDATGVDGLPLLTGSAPGASKLATLFAEPDRERGRPASLSFVALVVPPYLKQRMRRYLADSYSKTYSRLFPDLSGFAADVASKPLPTSV